MKKTISSSIIATGLLAFSSASSAAYYDFQAWTGTYGEQGFDNATPFSLTDMGLTLTATAFDHPATGPVSASHVYMDSYFNGIIGGMGVCTTLNSSAQCTPSSDDNVSIDAGAGEVLSWNFSQGLSSLTLELGDNDHFDFAGRSIEYSLDGSTWLTATTNASASLTIAVNGGGAIDFRAAGAAVTDQYYIRNADIAVVPVPAAVWLFGSGLLGLAGLARRRR